MKRNMSKQAKKASRLAKAENLRKKQAQAALHKSRIEEQISSLDISSDIPITTGKNMADDLSSSTYHTSFVTDTNQGNLQTSNMNIVTVKNAEGDPDTTAEIIIHNKIDYIPKVSVIMPVYNVEQYLRQCLDSVVNQTLKEIEIICVDDGSTDESLNILKEYASRDNRITVMRQKNLYAGVARNAGLAVAKGEYLSFLDSDDFFELTLLEEAYSIAQKEKSKIVFYQYTIYDEKEKKEKPGIDIKFPSEGYQIRTIHTRKISDNLFSICAHVPWNKLISHDFVKKEKLHFQALQSSNDTFFSFALLSVAKKITLYYKNLVHYRRNHEGSLVTTREKHPLNFYCSYTAVQKFLQQKSLWKKYKKTFLSNFLRTALWTFDRVEAKQQEVKEFIKNKIIPECEVFGKNRKLIDNVLISNLVKKLSLDVNTYQCKSVSCASKLFSYLLFPYYILRLAKLKKQYFSNLTQTLPHKLAEFRVDVKNTGKNSNSIEIKAGRASVSQPASIASASEEKSIISGFSHKQKINIKAINSGKLTLNFRGADKKDRNKVRFPLWCDYKSIKIDGKKINDKIIQTWHDQPFKYVMPVKDGQEVQLEIEQAYHKYSKADLKSVLLKLNTNSSYIKQNIDKLTDAVYKNIYPEALKAEKITTPDKQSALKHFLYHKIKTDTYTKTYICGIRVKRKPANIYEFIDKRLATLSKNWEKKFEAVANSGTENKKELLAQMASLNSACQKELKATGTALKKDIIALQKETNLIKSNTLYMIKSLDDKMAEVMNSQTVSAGIMQSIQAENTAEILNHLSKLPESVAENSSKNKIAIIEQIARLPEAIAQSSSLNKAEILAGVAKMQENGNANRTEIIEQIARLPETIAQSSSLNKAEILTSVAQIQENGNANRTEIIEQIARLPETIAKNSIANKAEILESVAQISENAKANHSAILNELTKLPENIAKNSVANKAEILESVAQISENAKTNRSAILNELTKLPENIAKNSTDNKTEILSAVADIAEGQMTFIKNNKSDFATIANQFSTFNQNAMLIKDDLSNQLIEQNKSFEEFKKKYQRQYQEINFADLLHDTIVQSKWLKDKSFSLYGWAANYSFIYTLYRILDQVNPVNILEMGLGQTTRVTSQYVAYKNKSATLNVCEHNKEWIDIYQPDLPSTDHFKINHLDLEYFDYEGKTNDKYADLLSMIGKQKFDLIIVDGPIGGRKNLPRSNILDIIKNGNLANDFIIIFDDAERAGEKATIEKAKELLNERNIEFCSFKRNGIKWQHIITSQSRSFVQYL